MDYFERQRKKQERGRELEQAGKVADSMEVRINLIKRFEDGEITFDTMQAELKRIKRKAKSEGKITRAKAYTGKY